ncbi:hypothetical protein [Paenibacillus sp. Soil750]|nr:hypothetical protein [Paenibacillus sp. Soil750]
MTSNRGQQGAHGTGQIVEQLNNQAEAAEQISINFSKIKRLTPA